MASLVVTSSVGLSVVAYLTTASLIPRLAPTFIAAGLKGKDMLKGTNRGGGGAGKSKQVANGNGRSNGVGKGWPVVPDRAPVTGKDLPESTGLIAGGVYVLVLALFAPVPFYHHFKASSSGPILPGTTAFTTAELCDWGSQFPHASLSTHLASLFSLLVAVFLGFLDDLFDIRWRFKLPIPIIASIPLLMTYAASLGVTDVILPKVFGLRRLLGVESTGGLVRLGPLYYLYMSLLSTFCTNSINILAGINGVEVGQALVIALSIVVNDFLHLKVDMSSTFPFSLIDGPVYLGMGLARGSAELQDRHLFSLYFMLPLVGVMLALLKFNWYPARAFIGDTFCYFAGMTIAVVGILGHFSKTLLLFFLPQTFNFIYSCPQIFGLVPIPRHRLPARDPSRDVLEPSTVLFVDPPTRKTTLLLKGMEALRLARLERTKKGDIISCTNLTLLNLVLLWRGPMREDRLTMWIMGIQVAGSVVAFGISSTTTTSVRSSSEPAQSPGTSQDVLGNSSLPVAAPAAAVEAGSSLAGPDRSDDPATATGGASNQAHANGIASGSDLVASHGPAAYVAALAASRSAPYVYGIPGSETAYPSTTPHLNPLGLEIRSSPTTGRGVYASKALKAGTVVDISPVLVVPRREYEAGVQDSVFKDYVFSWGKGGDQALALGLGSLFNHASSPNVSFRLNYDDQCVTYTLTRSVQAGEELHIFYGHNVQFGTGVAASEVPSVQAVPGDPFSGLESAVFADSDDIRAKESEDLSKVLTDSLASALPPSARPGLSKVATPTTSRGSSPHPAPATPNTVAALRARLADQSVDIPVADVPFQLITSQIAPEDQPLELIPAWVIDLKGWDVHPIFEWAKNSGLLTEEMQHLKRVYQKPGQTGDERSSLITVRQDLDRETLVSLLSSFPPLAAYVSPTNPYQVPVPKRSAHTPDQLQEWKQHWPVSYTPVRLGPTADIRSRDWTTGRRDWYQQQLAEVCELAERSRLERGELGIACSVYETYNPRVHAFGSPGGRVPVRMASGTDTRCSSSNPLCHAFAGLIDAVAELDRKGLRQTVQSPPSGADSPSGSSTPTKSDSPPYLLTGLTVFASHEPCLLCSMALLHSRIAVLCYARAMPGSGGCGSVYRVHEQEGLNHRFEVWQWTGGGKPADVPSLAVDA